MYKVLIIEDDQAIALIERDYLEINDFETTLCENGEKGRAEALTGKYDLILLDIMLPGIDGFTLCRELREKLSIPIIMVTARQDDADKIRGLGLGADDYVEKPFSPSVLIARVKANLAQYERGKQEIPREPEKIVRGDIELYTESHRVYIRGEEIFLKNKEYELLKFFLDNPDIVFSKETLYERIWGMDAIGDNTTVAVHINRIREKMEKDPSKPVYIQTVWGAGYRFVPATVD